MRFSRLGILVVALAASGMPVDPVHATQVCVGCPAPKKIRIQDGQWHTDVQLGPGITKADAELIIRAARRHEIAERPISDQYNDLPPIDIERVDYIGNASRYFVEPTPILGHAERNVRYFSVSERTTRNNSREHVIAIREGRVERVAVLSWVA